MESSGKTAVERCINQFLKVVPREFRNDSIIIKGFIDMLIENLICIEDIIAGVTSACEKKGEPELCKLILEEAEIRQKH